MARIGDGRVTVPAVGTPRPLSQAQAGDVPDTSITTVSITALATNTGLISVGGPNTRAAIGSERGVMLAAGATAVLHTDDLADVFVDVRTNGEGASFAWELPR